jgi:hypothetical protein|tara:strand:- start:200 stop:907 length:708 start_codon:yes stop_codon:yes gene_type:complete
MAQNLYVDGTEMTRGEFSWANVVATSFDSFQNMAEPYNSSERILQSFFNFINKIGPFDEEEFVRNVRNNVFIIEFPNPYNQTLWIPEYGTHVNVCGDTGNQWIADEELRANPTEHFLELVKRQHSKLNAWTDLRGDTEVYNDQAKAINTIALFTRAYHCVARIIVRETAHLPDGDVLRSVYHPYMTTKTHWYLNMPSSVLSEHHMSGTSPTEEGQKVFGRNVAKRLTRENIVAKK